MFNPEIMKQGAAAFGMIANGIDRIAAVQYAIAVRHGLPCPVRSADDPHSPCQHLAGHPEDHDWTPALDITAATSDAAQETSPHE